MPTRSAQATWTGDLKGGKGEFKGQSGAVGGGYSFGTRFENAAGIGVDQLARILIANPPKRRRRRGISPRDLTTTRRTMRRITNMSRSLSELCRHTPRRK